jgi:hypothetical protein
MYSLDFPVDDRVGWIGGVGGAILRTNSGGMTWVEEKAEGGRMRDELRFPTIMRAPDLVRFEGRVFDMTGRDVTDRKRQLTPGVYFLRSENAARTAKVILQH